MTFCELIAALQSSGTKLEPTKMQSVRLHDAKRIIRTRFGGGIISRFLRLLERLEPDYRRVIDLLFEVPDRWDKFSSGPSSRSGHHACSGGNLAHTVEVAEICMDIARNFEHEVDEQVLLLAALLHDIGKVDEYDQKPHATSMSDTGRWIGHKVMGVAIATEALRELRDARPKHFMSILNCLGGADAPSSHLRGYASLEAMIVSRADHISSAGDLFRQSMRLTAASSFYGIRHPHLREQPIHPVAARYQRLP